MTVTATARDADARTLTVTALFDAPVDRVWELWEDPRLLERWWGPPTYPATFVDHDIRPGGLSSYFMTGPEGDRPHGWWRSVMLDPPHRFEFESGFADETGTPDTGMPTMVIAVILEKRPGGGTTMTTTVTFPSDEAMERTLSMGMEEGLSAAMSQMDGLV
jgi:uncharacterized protein YndB with AHSA1/START domain